MSEHLKAISRFAAHLPVHAVLGLIAVYQRTLSSVLPVLFGPGCGCRFTPTCSHYAAEALRTHGFFAGLLLAARRLVKCTPLHPGGPDPVPSRVRPACLKVEHVDLGLRLVRRRLGEVGSFSEEGPTRPPSLKLRRTGSERLGDKPLHLGTSR